MTSQHGWLIAQQFGGRYPTVRAKSNAKPLTVDSKESPFRTQPVDHVPVWPRHRRLWGTEDRQDTVAVKTTKLAPIKQIVYHPEASWPFGVSALLSNPGHGVKILAVPCLIERRSKEQPTHHEDVRSNAPRGVSDGPELGTFQKTEEKEDTDRNGGEPLEEIHQPDKPRRPSIVNNSEVKPVIRQLKPVKAQQKAQAGQAEAGQIAGHAGMLAREIEDSVHYRNIAEEFGAESRRECLDRQVGPAGLCAPCDHIDPSPFALLMAHHLY